MLTKTSVKNYAEFIGHHDATVAIKVSTIMTGHYESQFTYTFRNFFHPYIGELIEKLNRDSLPGMLAGQLDPALRQDFFDALYHPTQNNLVHVNYFPKEIDVEAHGPYANYNWELFFHIPLTVATHLSKTRRFAESQRWFHYIFDPTSTDVATPAPARYWRFLGFRQAPGGRRIEEVVRLLSAPRTALSPADQLAQDEVMFGYDAIRNKPFQPHAVARTRPLAYQFHVVMKYLDNLIAWGDHLFQQDTIESINEATQRYVLAANILGTRPQRVPPRGAVRAKNFAQLKNIMGPIGNALVDLEGQFPFNLAAPGSGLSGGTGADGGSALFGIGRALYFCVPRNDKLLSYWDLVGDRLFKIRHCMNIQGVVRQLALFDPPIDPGMLVKAAAAGIDIGSIVNGLNQPVGPLRCAALIQKALELCAEVRGLGGALLASLEKGDAEHLALVRQRHESQIQAITREVRFLQLKSAQEATKSLLTSRATALERLHNFQRLLGLPAEANAPDTLDLGQIELTEENFDEAYGALVGQYDKALSLLTLPQVKLANEAAPTQQAGASGPGQLYLNANEDAELNTHLPTARDTRLAASVSDAIASVLTFIPDFDVKLAFWGMGAGTRVFGGAKLHDAVKGAADILRMISAWESDQAGMAARTAGHQRRAEDWMLQYNLAAHEVMQIGRQVLTSRITEQVARHEYLSIQAQIANAAEMDQLLHEKFTNEELYLWMQGEISRLYYEYYRFAFDTARKAERTMKQEVMRPELDAQDFVKFNYWDGGRKGLLSGEALHLDLKRMEMAYHENNKRELELTRHVSLRQVNPLALLTLKATGTCQVTIPEALYDRDCPGHFMRRIKSVAVSIPSVVGPYTNVHCTLSLLRSTVRTSPIPMDNEYVRQGTEDTRFVDYVGAVQSIVTSGASNDSGLFEPNLRDERFLPFEGAGAESTWKLDLPKDYRAFDYATISDVILHVRYTARQGVDPTKVKTALDDLYQQESQAGLALLFSLRHDFPTEWAAFANGAGDFTATIPRTYFPYFAQEQGTVITITGLELYDADDVRRHHAVGDTTVATAELLNAPPAFAVTAAPDAAGPTQVLTRAARAVFLIVRYTLG
jgi:hypothetical protein